MTVSAQAHPAVQGTLADWPVPGLLQQALRKQLTGRLTIVERSGDENRVFLREGTPVHVERPVDTDRLDRVLIELKVVPADVVARAGEQVAPGKRLGDVLQGMGALDQVTLADALKLQLRRKLMRLFSVRDGAFAIDVQPHGFGEGPELALMRVDPRLLFYPAIRASYDLARLDHELARLAGVEFKLVDLPDPAFEAMGVVPGDPAVLALRKTWQSLDTLNGLAARPIETRALTLAFLYAELLEWRQTAPKRRESLFGGPAAGEPNPGTASRAATSPPAPRGEMPTRAAIEDLHAKLDSMSHFELLKIPETASAADVSSAFVRGARLFHPDRLAGAGLPDVVPHAEQILARMSEAAMVLQDPARRAEYVTTLRTGRAPTENVPSLLDAETTFLKGEVFLKKGEYARAIECFTAAIKGNPNEPQYKAYLAWARFDDPRARKEAVVRDVQLAIQEVVEQQPRFARGHYWLGQLWKFLNEPARAEQAFREAVTQDKDFIDAGRELRLLEMRRRKATPPGKPDAPKPSGLMSRFFKK